MNDIWAGITTGLGLIVSGDPDLIEITLRSLQVSLSALVVSSVIALPLGTWLAIRRFRYRRLAIAVLNALMALPPVVVGLVVYLLLSRSGPFGVLGLLFTPTAMIIAQVIIITPLIASITHQAMRDLWAEYHDLLISLGTSPERRILTLILDGRRALLTAALAGFGRAIGEVGAIMIVGGNIDHATRVLTTAIALETGKGDFALALGLGFVLIGLALTVNVLIHFVSRTEKGAQMVKAALPVHMKDAVVRRGGQTLLGPVDLTLGTEGLTVLLGPNGAGKTTLLRALHGLERLSAGTVTWSVPDTLARARQAYVFQTPIMLRRSVGANLAYPLVIRGEKRAKVAHDVDLWAGRIGLTDALDQQATRLSGGEKQKLALGRALIGAPEILFLDEPCSNLDGRATREIEELLRVARQRGTRIVMTTHDLGQARRLADDIVFLVKGRICETGSAPTCWEAPQTPQLAGFFHGDILE